MLPIIFQAWNISLYSMSLSCGSTPLIKGQCNPHMLVPTLALFQKECNNLNGMLQYAIEIEEVPTLYSSTFVKEQYLKYFLQYEDKYTLLLLDPKDILDIKVEPLDVKYALSKQVIPVGIGAYKLVCYDLKISGTLTPKSNRTYVNKKVSMCFRSQIFI